tara:strand:- start:641 stop:4927 length:4287 start_codon:yes stop_codon:yes gene_type:complete
MTTPKLANLYENNELIDFYEIGNDSDDDDTNLGFNVPKRFTDFNKGFSNAEEFLALNDSLVDRFPQFQSSIFEYINNNNSEQIDTTVNETLDPANQNSGLYTDVSGSLKTNISKFFELPEEERTNIISTLKNRQGLVSDSSWVDADLNDSELFVANQNIFKRKGPEVTDKTLKYLGVYQFITKGSPSRKPRTRIKLDNVFKELTGYSFDDAIESRIPREVVESEKFQEGLNTFYNQNKDNITIPEKSKLSPFTNQLQSFGYEVSGGVGLGIATSPMLKAGVPGVVLYAITNGIGNYLLNEEAQQIRKGQAAGIGEEGKTSEGEKIAALITGAIPFSTNATGLTGIRNAAIQGGATTTAETTIRTLIEENRLPNAEETITALSVGTVFGAGFKGSLDLFSKFASKYAGKSAAQIDADLSNSEKKKVNKMIKDLQEIKKKEEKKLNEKVARVDDAFDRSKTNINVKKTKPQINPEQVGDPAFTDARVQNLINKGDIDTTIKSRTETLDAAIELKNNPNFKNIVSKVAKDRKINPSDEFQLAIALEITSLNNGILGVNQKLINALNVKNDPKEVTVLVGNLIDEIGKLDEFLADAIPLRSDQGSGLAIMQVPTEGLADMDAAKWNKLTETQKKDFLKLQSGGVSISTNLASKDLVEISDSINNALKIYNETGDPKTLNKLVNTIKRVNGNYTKINKLIKYGVLANIANGDVISKPLRVINEVWLSAILYGPDTHIVNMASSGIEAIVANSELYLDPKNLTNPREIEVAVKHSWNLLTGFDFALKGAIESYKLESNYFTGASKLDDFKDRIAFSMDGDGTLANIVNFFGKHFIRLPYKGLTSEDAFFQGLNINASAYSGATLQGIRKGLKGKELQDYINQQAELVIETFATKITKKINKLDPAQKKEAVELYNMVKDFGKRSTFSEDLGGGGELNILTQWLAEGSAKSPIVRRFIPFVRILKNLLGRQAQRTMIVGQLPFVSGFYNDYVNGSPLLQKQLRGRVVLSALTGSFIWSQMEKYTDPNNDVYLTGGGPTNREAWQKKWATNWRPYSVNFVQKDENGERIIGEDGNPKVKSYAFTRLDPISGLLMAYTDAYECSTLVEDGEIDDALTCIAVGGSRNITDRLFLQGINDFSKLVYEPQRAEKWLARSVASNIFASGFTRKAKNLPSDLFDMGLLNWTGVTADQALQWKLQLDTNVYKGDEGLAVGNKILNETTKTIPGWNNNLPPMREHITNKPIFKRQRPGIDLLTWFEVSESKNNPVLSVFAKIGKGVSEPTETINSFGGSIRGQAGIQIEPVELDTTQMSDLKYITNTIDINGNLPGDKGYNGKTLNKTMLQYMKTPWFKTNYEILKDVKKPWNTHPEIVEAILNGPPKGNLPGFREINNDFIVKGKDKFLRLNKDILIEHSKLKKLSRMKFIDMLKKANESVEY